MSYLSVLPEGVRQEKLEQFKKVISSKPELFRTLNAQMEPKSLEVDIEEKLDKLPEERKELYKELYKKFDDSIRLVDIKDMLETVEVPNGSSVSLLPLYENDLGENHYAGVYLHLLLHHEANGNIIPGKTKLLETSSGSGGIACSKVSKLLGYDSVIVLPGGGEKSREKAVKENGAELILTDGEQYVSAFPEFLKRYFMEHKQEFVNKELFFLSHMQGKRNSEGEFENNTITLTALSRIAYKILDKYNKDNDSLDYMVSGIGNGTNTLGIGGPLDLHGVKVIGFEPFQSGFSYEKKFPGIYKESFGIEPGSLGRHNMPGLSYNVNFKMPHLENSMDIIDDIYLISDKNSDKLYESTVGRTVDENNVVRYDSNGVGISEMNWGRSTKAGFHVAMELAKKHPNSNILFIGYDKANRYDDYNK